MVWSFLVCVNFCFKKNFERQCSALTMRRQPPVTNRQFNIGNETWSWRWNFKSIIRYVLDFYLCAILSPNVTGIWDSLLQASAKVRPKCKNRFIFLHWNLKPKLKCSLRFVVDTVLSSRCITIVIQTHET